MGREQRVVDENDNQQDVATVLTEIHEAVTMPAGAFEALNSC